MLALDTESQPQQLQELTLYLQGFWLQEIRWFKPQQEQAERSDSAAGAAHALHCPPAKVPQPPKPEELPLSLQHPIHTHISQRGGKAA